MASFGSLIRKIKTSEDYIRLVESVREDLFDLRESIEFDGDEMARASLFIDPLESEIEKLYTSFKDGSYQFADEDFPFMEIVKNNNHIAVMPMINSLKLINRIHREGLDID
ncbi:MAG: hypothetical protein QM479_07330 [Pseudomonadota bacterium]